MPDLYLQIRVLVVDCNRDAAEILGILLQAHGFSTQVECGKAEALKVAQTFRPDAVLIDLGYHTLETYELAAALRSNPDLPDVFLVTLADYLPTPFVAPDFRIDLRLTKPTGYRTLVEALQRHFLPGLKADKALR